MGQTIKIPAKPVSIPHLNRYRGCILGGAVGDALGYPTEHQPFERLQNLYGENGITVMEVDREDGKAIISADTQMTLFTIYGLLTAFSKISTEGAFLNAVMRGAFEASYLKWLYTQTDDDRILDVANQYGFNNHFDYDMFQPELMNIRKPGRTNPISLLNLVKGDDERPHSKGCGVVTRAAPFGLFYPDNYCEAYRRAGEGAAQDCPRDGRSSCRYYLAFS